MTKNTDVIEKNTTSGSKILFFGNNDLLLLQVTSGGTIGKVVQNILVSTEK